MGAGSALRRAGEHSEGGSGVKAAGEVLLSGFSPAGLCLGQVIHVQPQAGECLLPRRLRAQGQPGWGRCAPQKPGEAPQTPSELPNSSWIKRLFILAQKNVLESHAWASHVRVSTHPFKHSKSQSPGCGTLTQISPEVFLILKKLLLMDKSSYIFMGSTAVFYGTFRPVNVATVFCGENMQNLGNFEMPKVCYSLWSPHGAVASETRSSGALASACPSPPHPQPLLAAILPSTPVSLGIWGSCSAASVSGLFG